MSSRTSPVTTTPIPRNAVAFIEGRLYFAIIKNRVRESNHCHYWKLESDFVYYGFNDDFGPFNLGQLFVFCERMNKLLDNPVHAGKKIYFYASKDKHEQSNSAFLIGCYAVLYLGYTPDEAQATLAEQFPQFVPFRDASYGLSTFDLTHYACFRAVWKARALGWLNFDTFDPDEYFYYECVENGDMNWLVPNRILAFSGPADKPTYSFGVRLYTPEDYFDYFHKHNIGSIIRLNKKVYDRQKFIDAGFKHFDLYYLDGSNPPEAILQRVVEIIEEEPGAVAVHCKAGLGRTGTTVGVYLMKHFNLTAEEVIAWLRICRPGSVIGPQQQFLIDKQAQAWREGVEYRRRHNLPAPLAATIPKVSEARGGASASGGEGVNPTLTTVVDLGGGGSGSGTTTPTRARYGDYGTPKGSEASSPSPARETTTTSRIIGNSPVRGGGQPAYSDMFGYGGGGSPYSPKDTSISSTSSSASARYDTSYARALDGGRDSSLSSSFQSRGYGSSTAVATPQRASARTGLSASTPTTRSGALERDPYVLRSPVSSRLSSPGVGGGYASADTSGIDSSEFSQGDALRLSRLAHAASNRGSGTGASGSGAGERVRATGTVASPSSSRFSDSVSSTNHSGRVSASSNSAYIRGGGGSSSVSHKYGSAAGAGPNSTAASRLALRRANSASAIAAAGTTSSAVRRPARRSASTLPYGSSGVSGSRASGLDSPGASSAGAKSAYTSSRLSRHSSYAGSTLAGSSGLYGTSTTTGRPSSASSRSYDRLRERQRLKEERESRERARERERADSRMRAAARLSYSGGSPSTGSAGQRSDWRQY